MLGFDITPARSALRLEPPGLSKNQEAMLRLYFVRRDDSLVFLAKKKATYSELCLIVVDANG